MGWVEKWQPVSLLRRVARFPESFRAARSDRGFRRGRGAVAARRGFPAIAAGLGLAAVLRVAAFAGFTAFRGFTAGFDRTARRNGRLRLLRVSGDDEARGDTGDRDKGQEELDEFHMDLDLGFFRVKELWVPLRPTPSLDRSLQFWKKNLQLPTERARKNRKICRKVVGRSLRMRILPRS